MTKIEKLISDSTNTLIKQQMLLHNAIVQEKYEVAAKLRDEAKKKIDLIALDFTNATYQADKDHMVKLFKFYKEHFIKQASDVLNELTEYWDGDLIPEEIINHKD